MSKAGDLLEGTAGNILFDVPDVPLAGLFLVLGVPVMQLALQLRYGLRHFIIVAGVKGAPEGPAAAMAQDFRNILHILRGVIVSRERLGDESFPAQLAYGQQGKIPQQDQPGQ